MLVTDEISAFWSGKLSNFAMDYRIPYHDELWLSSEHIFMFEKAIFFSDFETAEKIKNADTPAKAKSLGRKVIGFNDKAWAKVREDKMMDALRAKFKVPEYQRFLLLTTGDTEIIEASPYDRIWGIGYAVEDVLHSDRETWGMNLLGKCLMQIREELKDGSL